MDKNLQESQQYKDGYQIPYTYQPRESQFQHYTGTLNLLDRDFWNTKLFGRNFLIEYPHWFNINRPQNSSPCIPPECETILTSPKWIAEATKYWNKYDKKFDPCNHQGIPTRKISDLGWDYQRYLAGCANVKSRPISHYEGEKCTPSVLGINRNVDVESKLYRLGYYNNRDRIPNDLGPRPELEDPQVARDLYNTYYSDRRHIYPNVTPYMWNNTTKIKNNYPPGVEYREYDRYLVEANTLFCQKSVTKKH